MDPWPHPKQPIISSPRNSGNPHLTSYLLCSRVKHLPSMRAAAAAGMRRCDMRREVARVLFAGGVAVV